MVVIVGSECPDLVIDCRMIQAAPWEKTLELTASKVAQNFEIIRQL